jgi:hypothetical protein
MLLGARYYDPSVGRFLSRDPIRYQGGDVNLYRYCGSNPVNGTDPGGHFVLPALAVGIGGAALVRTVLLVALTVGFLVGAEIGTDLAPQPGPAPGGGGGPSGDDSNDGGSWIRIVGDREKGVIEYTGQVPSSETNRFGNKNPTRAFKALFLDTMVWYADWYNNNDPRGITDPYTSIVTFPGTGSVPPSVPNVPAMGTWYVDTGQLNGSMTGPPIIVPLR